MTRDVHHAVPVSTLLTRRRVTMKDVAARAGVTQSAVSVVLNGARSNTLVSPLKRQRIMQVAQGAGLSS
jgi:DNA-binding LacI/PurR family transcriptional regulator